MNKIKVIILSIVILLSIGYIIYAIYMKNNQSWKLFVLVLPLIISEIYFDLSEIKAQNSALFKLELKEAGLKRKLVLFLVLTPIVTFVAWISKIEYWYIIIPIPIFLIMNDILDYLGVPTNHGRSQEEIDKDNEEATNEFIDNFKNAIKKEKEKSY